MVHFQAAFMIMQYARVAQPMMLVTDCTVVILVCRGELDKFSAVQALKTVEDGG
jgi:hypothetical protein